MILKDLHNKLIAILGYGQEGEATARYLIKHRVEPVLFDQRPWDQWPKEKQEEIKKLGLNFIFGPDCFKELAGFDIAFRSPGISLSHPDLQLRIKDKGLKMVITSQTKWFFDNCPSKIIGVTGTKGKGTTASLIYEILKKQFPISNFQFPNIYITGNIGKVQPFDILDDLKAGDFVVYELSSFQLQDLNKSPHIAVVLMTTSEHLDYHKDNEEYVDAKSALTKFQTADDFAIINADYPSSVKLGEQSKGKKLYFSTQKELEQGCFIKDNNQIVINALGQNIQYPISNIQLKGRHNLENICAAATVGACLNIDFPVIQKAVESFKGLEHRLEFVAEKEGIHPVKSAEGGTASQSFNGVKFYNDSFSTTPETAIAAIKSFNQPLIVILGGSSKNSKFDDLAETIKTAPNIKAIILIGGEGIRIKEAVGKSKITMMEGAKNMREIFEQIKSIAKSGDVVLLSPACASFDMFKNYQDRGEQFKKMVDLW